MCRTEEHFSASARPGILDTFDAKWKFVGRGAFAFALLACVLCSRAADSRESFRDSAHLEEIVGRLVKRAASPAVTIRLRDGSEGVTAPITVGASSLSDVEILSGLKQGERIVISDTTPFNSAEQVLVSN